MKPITAVIGLSGSFVAALPQGAGGSGGLGSLLGGFFGGGGGLGSLFGGGGGGLNLGGGFSITADDIAPLLKNIGSPDKESNDFLQSQGCKEIIAVIARGSMEPGNVVS
jgi:hypothetical protein